jgi:hypothetical protein
VGQVVVGRGAGWPATFTGHAAPGRVRHRLQREGAAVAARMFPAVAGHLATNCGLCAEDLEELLAFAAQEYPSGSADGEAWRVQYGIER